MIRRLLVVMLGMYLSAGARWADAHHSTAMYDYSKSVTLSGAVLSFQWTNPHCFLQLIATDEKGNQTQWPIEMGVPAMLARMGWSKQVVKSGDQVTVVIAPLRDGSVGGTLITLTLADGTMLKGAAAGIQGGPPPGTSPADTVPPKAQ